MNKKKLTIKEEPSIAISVLTRWKEETIKEITNNQDTIDAIKESYEQVRRSNGESASSWKELWSGLNEITY